MKDTTFLPPESLAAADRADRSVPRARVAVRRRRRRRSCAASSTIRRRGGWTASPGTPGCSAPRPTCRASAGCCSAAAASDGARILSPADRRADDDAVDAGRRCATCAASAGTSTRPIPSNRGELFPIGSFGHTGFTGTSLWIDPGSEELRRLPVEPRASRRQGRRHAAARQRRDGCRRGAAVAGTIVARRSRRAGRSRRDVASAAADSAAPQLRARTPVLTGIDVLRAESFARLRGKRVGLLTNHTGRSRDGASTIDLLADAPGVTLVALFSPEHGIRGDLDDERSPSSRDEKTGLPIHSLYGETRRPTDAMLDGLDAIVIDLQDIGARFYTYTTTIGVRDGGGGEAQAAGRRARSAEPDRRLRRSKGRAAGSGRRSASPATSADADPPRPDASASWRGCSTARSKIGADLTVVAMKNWRRDDWFDETGPAVDEPVAEHAQPERGDALSGHRRDRRRPTSRSGAAPTRRSSRSARRGSTACALAAALNAAALAGRPLLSGDVHAGGGRQARRPSVPRRVHDRHRSRSPASRPRRPRDRVGAVEDVRRAVQAGGRRDSCSDRRRCWTKIRAGDDPAAIAASWAADEAKWRLTRAKYLLY